MSRVYEAMRRAEAMGLVPRLSPTAVYGQSPLPAAEIPPHESGEIALQYVGRRGVTGDAASTAVGRREEIKLVQQLFLSPGSAKRRSVLFVGVEQENGSAVVCARAGETLTRHEYGSVCLVDANLRTPSLHRHFGVPNREGLVSALRAAPAGLKPSVRVSPGDLWLLSSGPSTQDSDLLLTDRTRPCIEALSVQFDRVLITAPPIDTCAEAIALSRLVDAVVLVIQAHTTRREAVRNAKASLEAVNVTIAGVVLNNRTFPIPELLYRML